MPLLAFSMEENRKCKFEDERPESNEESLIKRPFLEIDKSEVTSNLTNCFWEHCPPEIKMMILRVALNPRSLINDKNNSSEYKIKKNNYPEFIKILKQYYRFRCTNKEIREFMADERLFSMAVQTIKLAFENNASLLSIVLEDAPESVCDTIFKMNFDFVCPRNCFDFEDHSERLNYLSILTKASRKGYIKFCEMLILNGIFEHIVKENLELIQAIYLRKDNKVQDLIRTMGCGDGALVNDKNGLMISAEIGDIKIVKLILDSICCIYPINPEYKDLCDRMVRSRIDKKDSAGRTALLNAAKYGHKEIVEMLLDKGADVNHKDEDGYTALIIAADFGHKDTVRLLLDRGADVNAQTGNGETALTIAVGQKHKEIAQILQNHLDQLNQVDIAKFLKQFSINRYTLNQGA